jgi:hypothetical protein
MQIPEPEKATTQDYLEAWQGLRQELLEFFNAHAADFNKKPADGSWSMAENAEHLYLVNFFLARSIPIVLAGKFGKDMNAPEKIDYSGLQSTLTRGRYVNPEAVAPQSDWSLEEARLKLDQAMQRLEKSLAGQSADRLRSRGYDHPLQGTVNLMQYLWIQIQHEEMHLKIMRQKLGTLPG